MSMIMIRQVTAELVVSALGTAAMSPHHPWCRVATSGPKQPCSCHVRKAALALEALAVDAQAVPQGNNSSPAGNEASSGRQSMGPATLSGGT